ncbi:hypothetical protein [Metabacillus fastidiosus]|uniref:hypothetical protein n=1 Tax=Metabacillus fastidiosus TaxID=1458 RepID=UPI003D2821E7
MFLSGLKVKNTYYIYLTAYNARDPYGSRKKTLYKFGRLDEAVLKMYYWRDNFSNFPYVLVELGCTEDDLREWINTLETGITKTGRKFSAVV